MAPNFHSATNGLIWATIARGVNFRPDLNFLLSEREIISFTFEPPTSMTRIFLFKIAFELTSVMQGLLYLAARFFRHYQFLNSR